MAKDDSNLSDMLRKMVANAGISVHALEKQAGLKRSAVQNIIHGRSKKPSAEILHAITKVLDCSIDDLLGESSTPTPSNITEKGLDSSNDQKPFDLKLYSKAVKSVAAACESKNLVLSTQESLSYINEVYQYSISSNKSDIDEHFVSWLVNKSLKK